MSTNNGNAPYKIGDRNLSMVISGYPVVLQERSHYKSGDQTSFLVRYALEEHTLQAV